jgi:hypothetical protein
VAADSDAESDDDGDYVPTEYEADSDLDADYEDGFVHRDLETMEVDPLPYLAGGNEAIEGDERGSIASSHRPLRHLRSTRSWPIPARPS